MYCATRVLQQNRTTDITLRRIRYLYRIWRTRGQSTHGHGQSDRERHTSPPAWSSPMWCMSGILHRCFPDSGRARLSARQSVQCVPVMARSLLRYMRAACGPRTAEGSSSRERTPVADAWPWARSVATCMSHSVMNVKKARSPSAGSPWPPPAPAAAAQPGSSCNFELACEYISDMNVQKARSLSASRPWPLPAAGSTIIACLPRDMSSSGLAPVVYEVTRNPSPFSLCIGHMTSKGSARRAPARALHS